MERPVHSPWLPGWDSAVIPSNVPRNYSSPQSPHSPNRELPPLPPEESQDKITQHLLARRVTESNILMDDNYDFELHTSEDSEPLDGFIPRKFEYDPTDKENTIHRQRIRGFNAVKRALNSDFVGNQNNTGISDLPIPPQRRRKSSPLRNQLPKLGSPSSKEYTHPGVVYAAGGVPVPLSPDPARRRRNTSGILECETANTDETQNSPEKSPLTEDTSAESETDESIEKINRHFHFDFIRQLIPDAGPDHVQKLLKRDGSSKTSDVQETPIGSLVLKAVHKVVITVDSLLKQHEFVHRDSKLSIALLYLLFLAGSVSALKPLLQAVLRCAHAVVEKVILWGVVAGMCWALLAANSSREIVRKKEEEQGGQREDNSRVPIIVKRRKTQAEI